LDFLLFRGALTIYPSKLSPQFFGSRHKERRTCTYCTPWLRPCFKVKGVKSKGHN